jgi:hypothetical protein
MTIPIERTRAVQYAQDFLRELLDPKKTPKVPREIRRRAYIVLKHFPGYLDLLQSYETLPDTWGKPEDSE